MVFSVDGFLSLEGASSFSRVEVVGSFDPCLGFFLEVFLVSSSVSRAVVSSEVVRVVSSSSVSAAFGFSEVAVSSERWSLTSVSCSG